MGSSREALTPARDRANGYNEIVLDAASWEARMPSTVEAIFYMGAFEAQARELHASFLAAYGLTGAEAERVPLLVYFPSGNLHAPFSLVG